MRSFTLSALASVVFCIFCSAALNSSGSPSAEIASIEALAPPGGTLSLRSVLAAVADTILTRSRTKSVKILRLRILPPHTNETTLA
jgi:hypothetical protein